MTNYTNTFLFVFFKKIKCIINKILENINNLQILQCFLMILLVAFLVYSILNSVITSQFATPSTHTQTHHESLVSPKCCLKEKKKKNRSQRLSYGLNICVTHPHKYVEPYLFGDGIWRQALWELIKFLCGHEAGPPIMGLVSSLEEER